MPGGTAVCCSLAQAGRGWREGRGCGGEKENLAPSVPASPVCVPGRGGRGRRRSSHGTSSAVRTSRDSLSPFQILSSSQEYEQLPRGNLPGGNLPRGNLLGAAQGPLRPHSLCFDAENTFGPQETSHEAASPLRRPNRGGAPQDLEAFASTPPPTASAPAAM